MTTPRPTRTTTYLALTAKVKDLDGAEDRLLDKIAAAQATILEAVTKIQPTVIVNVPAHSEDPPVIVVPPVVIPPVENPSNLPAMVVYAKPAALPRINGKIQPTSLVSVNLSGGDFGGGNIPGVRFKDYVYPDKHFAMYAAAGLNHFRVPFKAGRFITPSLDFSDAVVNTAISGQIKAVLDAAAAAECCVILDMHDYLEFNLGGTKHTPLTNANLMTTFWPKVARLVAEHFGSHPALYGFDIMNEPQYVTGAQWNKLAQDMVDAYRAIDKETFLFVEGISWSGAHSFTSQNSSFAITDPANRMYVSLHQYMDRDSSGQWKIDGAANTSYAAHTAAFQSGDMQGVAYLKKAVDFLKAKGYTRFHLGEYGVPTIGADEARWLPMMDNLLSYMNTEKIMSHWWSVGDWWPGTYPMKIDLPLDGDPLRPQLNLMQKYNAPK